TYGSEHIQIAKEATSTIPIVALMGDPVGSGLVASLAHPGGNLTGLSGQNADLNGKRFELLHEIVPNLRRLAVLFNGNNLAYRLESDIVRAAAIPLGLVVLAAEIRSGDDIAPTFAAIATDADALLVVGEPLTFTYRSQISALALAARLPTTYSTRGYVEAGGLMSYGPNFPALFRRMADYVNKILRGTKPEDLPVEQPTRYDLIVNLTTARRRNVINQMSQTTLNICTARCLKNSDDGQVMVGDPGFWDVAWNWPPPFVTAVAVLALPMAGVIWFICQLRYKQQIATLKDRVELADEGLGDAKEKIVKAGEEKTALHTTVKELNAQIEKLKKRKAQLPRELQSIVDRLATSSATASKQVSKLSEAQEAAAAAVSKHSDKPDPLSGFAKKP